MSISKILSIYQYIIENHSSIDKIKAMKLPYIAFGFYGAMHNKDHLFDNDIQAWKHGPVIPDLYQHINTGLPIDNQDLMVLETDETECIDLVIELYGKKPSFKLVDLTHQAGTPWHKVYESGQNNTIPKEDVIKHYSTIVNSAKLANKLSNVFETLAAQ